MSFRDYAVKKKTKKNDEMKEELKRITFGKAKKKNEMKKQMGNKQKKSK